MKEFNLRRAVQVLLFLYLVVASLIYAKPFLVPLAFAALLSMLFLPLSAKLESWGVNRALSIVICLLIFLITLTVIGGLLSWQIAGITEDAAQIEQNIDKTVEKVRRFLSNEYGISRQKQKEIVQGGQSPSQTSGFVTGFLSGTGGFITDAILMLVYTFLIMYYKGHLKKFILILVKNNKKEKAADVIADSRKVAAKYLSGMALMIVWLWVMYSIGFSIVGVKNAIFFAVLCGLLEIIPFVGNLTGSLLTLLMVIAQGGAFSMILGVIITYAMVQFIQTYLLEPMVVGAGVNLNPLFTIIGLVLGELVWGIPGMVLAIPLLAITKIVFDNIEELKPYGFLLGEERKGNQHSFMDRVKGWFGK